MKILRRLKSLGATAAELLDIYDKQVRAVLELAVPVWQPALTKYESRQIERVQRSAFYIILGEEYKDYENALNILKRETLNERRVKLCEKFARKTVRNPNYANWFCPNNRLPNTRGNKSRSTFNLKPVNTRTYRFEKSPIPYMTKLLNDL